MKYIKYMSPLQSKQQLDWAIRLRKSARVNPREVKFNQGLDDLLAFACLIALFALLMAFGIMYA